MCNILDPMAQDIPEQDIVMGELELPPQMDPKPEMGAAAAEATNMTPPLPSSETLPPIPAETARPGTPDMVQLFAMLAEITNGINNKMNEISKNTIQTMRGEMRQMGRGCAGGHGENSGSGEGRSTDNGRQNGDATCYDQRAGGECTGG